MLETFRAIPVGQYLGRQQAAESLKQLGSVLEANGANFNAPQNWPLIRFLWQPTAQAQASQAAHARFRAATSGQDSYANPKSGSLMKTYVVTTRSTQADGKERILNSTRVFQYLTSNKTLTLSVGYEAGQAKVFIVSGDGVVAGDVPCGKFVGTLEFRQHRGGPQQGDIAMLLQAPGGDLTLVDQLPLKHAP